MNRLQNYPLIPEKCPFVKTLLNFMKNLSGIEFSEPAISCMRLI